MQALTISQLEKATGVPRGTIYYYVREGLLPAAQKAAASRAIYADVHVELLLAVTRLKDEGLALQAIRERLASRLASARAVDFDLVAEQTEQTRQSILLVAARLFVCKGYKRTRVADIIKEVGITPPLFYAHFASKQELFVESFGGFVEWMRGFLEDRLRDEPDPVARGLARVHSYLGVQALSPDLMSLVRSEAMHEDGDMRTVVEGFYEAVISGTREDLMRLREEADTALPVTDELVAFGLLGGLENVVRRAAWDERYSVEDVLWTSLCIFLGVEAIYSGRVDLTHDLDRYRELVGRLAATPQPIPPGAVA
jgi:AcrR family transcriptional regulator